MSVRILENRPVGARNESCSSCGSSSDKRKYVDFGIFVEYEGPVIICVPCIELVGAELGFITKKEHEFVAESNKRLRQSNEGKAARIEDLKNQLDNEAVERAAREQEHKTAIEEARVQAVQATERRLMKATK
jgi:hypothetical protein